jgi:hypothetical protein
MFYHIHSWAAKRLPAPPATLQQHTSQTNSVQIPDDKLPTYALLSFKEIPNETIL